MSILLRVEGVNFGGFIYDTRKLPIIRGASLLILEAPRAVQLHLQQKVGACDAISLGASAGFFEVQPKLPSTTAEEVRDEAEKFFATTEPYCHATFVAAAISWNGKDFPIVREKLVSLVRLRQMKACSVTVPAPGARAEVACSFDGVRPALHSRTLPGAAEPSFISAATQARWKEGGSEKRKAFYQRYAGIPDPPEFTEDFEDLAESGPGNLNGKMAVIYADGNRFSSLMRNHSRTGGAMQKHDEAMRDPRTGLLKAVVQAARTDPGWKLKAADGLERVRLETLLWGGDDMLWVVPAWRGWRLLELLIASTANWNLAGDPLTHAIGIVFCAAKAPIHRIKHLAEDLCGAAKDEAKRAAPIRNALAYAVLESVDHTGANLEDYWAKRYGAGRTPAELTLNPVNLSKLRTHRERLDAVDISRKKLHEVAQLVVKGGDFAPALESLMKLDAFKAALPDLETIAGSGPLKFVHLLELWDYLA